jgi:hypothetical protein
MGNIMNRFVVVGSIKGGDGEVTKYNDSESRLATAIYRANLEDADKAEKQTITFNVAKAQADNDEMIRSIFGHVE